MENLEAIVWLASGSMFMMAVALVVMLVWFNDALNDILMSDQAKAQLREHSYDKGYEDAISHVDDILGDMYDTDVAHMYAEWLKTVPMDAEFQDLEAESSAGPF